MWQKYNVTANKSKTLTKPKHMKTKYLCITNWQKHIRMNQKHNKNKKIVENPKKIKNPKNDKN